MQDLINAGAKVDATDKDGRSSLHHAASIGHSEIVRLLLENGEDVHKRCARGGLTALHLAMRDGNLPQLAPLAKQPLGIGNEEVAQHLIEYGAKVKANGARILGQQYSPSGLANTMANSPQVL